VVLPGVGAFQTAVKNLKQRKLFKPIQEWIRNGNPFLGICLGYQLLFENGEESKNSRIRGMSIFKGNVQRLPNKKGLKIPHIGWNQIRQTSGARGLGLGIGKGVESRVPSPESRKDLDLFKSIPDGSYFYFVHSYVPVPKQKQIIRTTTDYGTKFASSIQQGCVFACQFHPEKSGENGLKLLKNFTKGL
jgi:glutamine amidotransferase